jgi:hypothetical protein
MLLKWKINLILLQTSYPLNEIKKDTKISWDYPFKEVFLTAQNFLENYVEGGQRCLKFLFNFETYFTLLEQDGVPIAIWGVIEQDTVL